MAMRIGSSLALGLACTHAQTPGVRVVCYKVVGLTELVGSGLEVDATYLLFQSMLCTVLLSFSLSDFFVYRLRHGGVEAWLSSLGGR